MPRGRSGRRPSKGDGRREQLLELGLRLFGKRSYAEISIDDIAGEAEISRGLLYHYFHSKRGFYTETVRHAAEQLVARVETDPSLPPSERARAGIAAYLDYVERFAGAYAVLLRGGLGVDAPVKSILEEARRRIIEKMIAEAPELEPTPEVQAALRGWIHLVEGMALDWIEHHALDRNTLLDVLTESLWTIVETATGIRPAGR